MLDLNTFSHHKPVPVIESRYIEALRTIPAPGGNGCHTSLLGVANLGIMTGKDPHELHEEIRQAIPAGQRRVRDREITDAINKALADHRGGTFTPRPRPAPAVRNGNAARQRIINQGRISDDADLWEESPFKIKCLPEETPGLLLSTLFEPDDLVWIGERQQAGILGETIRRASEWVEHFQGGGMTGPHIIINPLNGIFGPKKSGDGETLRGDHNVSAFRYCMVEFDDLSREDQIRFWSAIKLPIVALIDTGGKSIHAWVQVSKLATVNTLEQWQEDIKIKLYDRILAPLGVDAACSNPSRLSRLPGHYREEKHTTQRLLWLSSEGRPVC
ncbi:MAG: hypothetical protein WBL58_11160 [Peptococcia bacterium]